MSTTYYTDEHEWLRVEGDVATVGITNYAQEQLGDLVFVDLPTVGTTMEQGDDVVVVESVKAASDVYAPASGEVLEVNEALANEPALVNSDAEEAGWLYKMKL
ncbi:MAG: glycine cleavage system protein GcvH, partial [Hyphomicrobiales bacterium]